MQIALIGMNQSGKTSLFAALTEGHIHADAGLAHQVDHAIVKVPDERLGVLTEMYKPKKTVPATIEFLDFPGVSFAEESQRHEARRMISQARQLDMLVLIVRAFTNDSVPAYRNRVDAQADIEEFQTELFLADLESVENRIGKLEIAITRPTKTKQQDSEELERMRRYAGALEEMTPLSQVIQSPEEEKFVRSFGFLTLKPLLIVLNVNEDKIGTDQKSFVEGIDTPILTLSTAVEAELAQLEPEDRAVFLEDIGLTEIARDRLIRQCYKMVGLVSFLTVGPDEVRAWTIPAGTAAVEAAGEIHSDIQRGFIRAETVAYDDLIAGGDMKGAKAAGKVRLEGKQYIVQDGDIINFRFNV